MNIVGDLSYFRAIEESDLSTLNLWANEPALQTLIGGWHFPSSLSDQQQWFSGLNCQSNDQRFAIVLKDEHKLIGTTNLVSIDWKNRTAFTGVMIGDSSCRGRGLGRDIVLTMMRYAFEELDLHQLDTEIISYNEPSIRTYVNKCGWEIQGVKKDWYYRKGARWDKLILGVTKSRYLSLDFNKAIGE